jgi:hypothetical protein
MRYAIGLFAGPPKGGFLVPDPDVAGKLLALLCTRGHAGGAYTHAFACGYSAFAAPFPPPHWRELPEFLWAAVVYDRDPGDGWPPRRGPSLAFGARRQALALGNRWEFAWGTKARPAGAAPGLVPAGQAPVEAPLLFRQMELAESLAV